MRCRSFRHYGQALARNLGLHPVTLESMNKHMPIVDEAVAEALERLEGSSEEQQATRQSNETKE